MPKSLKRCLKPYPYSRLIQRLFIVKGGNKSLSKASSVNSADTNGHSSLTSAARARQSCTAPRLTSIFPAMTLTVVGASPQKGRFRTRRTCCGVSLSVCTPRAPFTSRQPAILELLAPSGLHTQSPFRSDCPKTAWRDGALLLFGRRDWVACGENA
jgi:hypothetical protein